MVTIINKETKKEDFDKQLSGLKKILRGSMHTNTSE